MVRRRHLMVCHKCMLRSRSMVRRRHLMVRSRPIVRRRHLMVCSTCILRRHLMVRRRHLLVRHRRHNRLHNRRHNHHKPPQLPESPPPTLPQLPESPPPTLPQLPESPPPSLPQLPESPPPQLPQNAPPPPPKPPMKPPPRRKKWVPHTHEDGSGRLWSTVANQCHHCFGKLNRPARLEEHLKVCLTQPKSGACLWCPFIGKTNVGTHHLTCKGVQGHLYVPVGEQRLQRDKWVEALRRSTSASQSYMAPTPSPPPPSTASPSPKREPTQVQLSELFNIDGDLFDLFM
ncbi:protein VASP homolog [Drosophila ananassae]|uniref:protein VASP homolog n=1 Tax=Drosophila ananassae TaxID=7217 RepID=UPI0013A5DE97|nr:protein VASP homolog [Drosophila ananassae]